MNDADTDTIPKTIRAINTLGDYAVDLAAVGALASPVAGSYPAWWCGGTRVPGASQFGADGGRCSERDAAFRHLLGERCEVAAGSVVGKYG